MDSIANEAILTSRTASDRCFVISHLRAFSLLVFAAAYLLFFSHAIPTFIDEGYSYNLATDKSLGHLISALRDGADGSFPLYALVIWGWEKLFGPSELSLRLNSGLFVLLFVWHSSRNLKRLFGPAIAALAIVFVLADKTFTYYALQARFYGLLAFLFSLCFWSTWDLLQAGTVSNRRRLWHALFCGLLCLSHPLGLLYEAILTLLYVLFAWRVKVFSLATAAAFLGGPAFFLLWLPSFVVQRLVNPTYASELSIPGWSKYWRFAFFGNTPLCQVLFGGVVVFLCARWLTKYRNKGETVNEHDSSIHTGPLSRTGNHLLVLYSLSFIICLNVAVALLDAARVIPVYWMLAVRYVLVSWIPYLAIIGVIFLAADGILQRTRGFHWGRPARLTSFALIMGALLMEMESHWDAWFKERARDKAWLNEIAGVARAKHMDVVCGSHCDAFYLATRTPTSGVKYLLPDSFPYRRLMLQMAKHYPLPSPIAAAQLAQCTNKYVFVPSGRRGFHIEPKTQ